MLPLRKTLHRQHYAIWTTYKHHNTDKIGPNTVPPFGWQDEEGSVPPNTEFGPRHTHAISKVLWLRLILQLNARRSSIIRKETMRTHMSWWKAQICWTVPVSNFKLRCYGYSEGRTTWLLTPSTQPIPTTRGLHRGAVTPAFVSADAHNGEGCRQIEYKCDSTSKGCTVKFPWLSQFGQKKNETTLHPTPYALSSNRMKVP